MNDRFLSEPKKSSVSLEELKARNDELQSQNAELVRRISELEAAREGVHQSRIAALNLLEDAMEARRLAQAEMAERQRSEEALRQSEERLRLRERELTRVQVIGGVGGIDIDITHGLTSRRSPEYLRLHGLTSASLEESHDDWLRRVHAEDREEADQTLKRALAGESAMSESEYRIIRPSDGEERWIYALADIERDSIGQPTRLVGAHIDITARKRAELQVAADLRDTDLLRELSAQLDKTGERHTLYERIVAAAIAFTKAQAGTVQILDEERSELVLTATQGFSREMVDYFYRVDASSQTPCGMALRSHQRAFVEFDRTLNEDPHGHMRKHVEAGLLSAQTTPLISRSGRIIGMVSTHCSTVRRPSDRELRFLDLLARQAADLIERYQSEEALRRSEERYRTLFETIDEGFCLIEVLFDSDEKPFDYRFIETNPAFTKHTGLPEAAGRTIKELAPNLDSSWVEIYGDVTLTGVSRRFDQRADALGRHYDVYAFRVGAPEQHQVAILFNDISERLKVENLLRASESYLSAVFAKAEVGISELSKEGRFLRVNDTFCRILQRSRDELLNIGAIDITHPDDIPITMETLQRLRQSGEPVSVDKRYLRPDGSFIWGNSRLSLLDHGEGNISILAVTADMTGRRAVEQALRESENRLQTLANEVPQIIWSTSSEGRANYFNRQWLVYTGLTHLESIGGGWQTIVHPDDAEASIKLWQEALLTGEAFETEYRLRRADGTYRWHIGRIVPLRGDDGKVSGWFGTATDVHDLKEARDAYAEARERLRLIVDSAHEHAIFSMDPERRITSWNLGAERIFGRSADEALGKLADFIFLPEDRERDQPLKEAKDARTLGRAGDNRWHQRADGSRFWANGVMLPMRAQVDDEVIGFVKILTDETETLEARKALTAALEESEKAKTEAEAAGRAKDHFLAVLSHELRTPLTPVSMIIKELLRDPANSPSLQEDLEVIDRNVIMECRLIDDLLDLSRIVHGKFEVHRAPLDLHAAIQEAVLFVRVDLDSKSQTLSQELNADHSKVFGDKIRLQQVIWNLLKNASKFTRTGGALAVRTYNDGSDLVVEISDNGIGMTPETIDRIFEAFAQGSVEITRQFGGLGLGLAISNATLSAHEGRITASSPGISLGSTFSFRLATLS